MLLLTGGDPAMSNLALVEAPEERVSFAFDGNSQCLDQVVALLFEQTSLPSDHCTRQFRDAEIGDPRIFKSYALKGVELPPSRMVISMSLHQTLIDASVWYRQLCPQREEFPLQPIIALDRTHRATTPNAPNFRIMSDGAAVGGRLDPGE